MRAAKGIGALALTWALCGCYSYQPVTLEQVRPDTRVRARLTADEASRLGSVVPVDGRLVEGEVLETGSGGLLLLVPVTTDLVGTRVQTLSQRLNIPASGVVELELRQLDRLKTGLAVGAGVAVVGAAVAGALSGGGRSDRPGGGDPPGDLVVPVGWLLRLAR